jgi:hypothetical protein
MSELGDDITFEPYQIYAAQVATLEDFAQQTRLCYKIARSFVQDGGAVRQDDPQERLVHLAGPIGDEPFASMGEMLRRSCLLLEWGFFENFLHSTVRELLLRHPAGLITAAGHDTLDYATIIEDSRQLTALDQLHQALVTRVIEHHQIRGQGVFGLIDLLKSAFHFQYDPYEVTYSLKGVQHSAQHTDLIELCAVRDALAQDRPASTRALLAAYPHFDDGAGGLHVPEDYYRRATSLLGATSAAIARSIDSRWYEAP